MEHLNNCPQAGEVILGVDTHLDVHVGVVIDAVGRLQGTLAVAIRMVMSSSCVGRRALACCTARAWKAPVRTAPG